MTGALHNLALMLLARFPHPHERQKKTHPSKEEQLAREQFVYAFPWEQLRMQHTSALRAQLLELVDEAEYKPATANQHLAALRGVLRAAWELQLLTTDAYQRAINIKDISGDSAVSGRSLEEGELEKILRACASDPTKKGCRDLAMIYLLALTGFRRDEVAALNRQDYHLVTHEVIVRRSKRRKGRVVYLEEIGAREALEAWLGFRGDSDGALFLRIRRGGHIVWGAVIPPQRATTMAEDDDGPEHNEETTSDGHLTDQAVYNIVLERAKEAKLTSHLTPHDFRRDYIGNLLSKGVDLSIAQELAGHSDPKTTKNYDRRPPQVKKEAAQKLEAPHIRWRAGAARIPTDNYSRQEGLDR
jgi:integrase